MKRVAASILMAVALASVVFAAGASGHRFGFESRVTSDYNDPNRHSPYMHFKGEVFSEKARCVKDRRVVLKKREADGSVTTIAQDYTDREGVWLIVPASAPEGTYFARATKKVIRKDGVHRHTCLPDVSKDMRVK